MLLTMMIMLAIASTIVEMMFAANLPIWRSYAHKHKWFNMTISIFLSFILGIAFGAAGVIALGAAMISTVLSIPGYAFLHWNFDSEQAKKAGGNLYAKKKKEWVQAISDLFTVIYKFIRFITAPIWITRSAIIKFNTVRAKYAK